MIMKKYFSLIMLLLCLLPAQTVMGQQHRRGTKARRHVIQRTRNNPKTFKAPTVNKEMVEKEQLLYDEVDEMPEFPGGINALMTWLGENVSYPEESEKKGVQGTVVAMFVVESDGSVSNAEIEKSVDPLLDLEVLELITKMPNWKPGKKDGHPVRVLYHLPVKFQLPAPDPAPADTETGE